ncbi:hypothetical protein BDM02DRAFT_2340009 [Thelephora ganbajun]|uniref:Uncharacterized protein n=1 Tax=Thelephora ganbajun TaxID=370292 RepID=A0ACB6YXY5_THEGA|nr:hypothetical protein BDM02DRAFT_2340009 [Thelephora ganbajun]
MQDIRIWVGERPDAESKPEPEEGITWWEIFRVSTYFLSLPLSFIYRSGTDGFCFSFWVFRDPNAIPPRLKGKGRRVMCDRSRGWICTNVAFLMAIHNVSSGFQKCAYAASIRTGAADHDHPSESHSVSPEKIQSFNERLPAEFFENAKRVRVQFSH